MAVGGAERDAQGQGGLLGGQSREVPELDDFGYDRLLGGELIESLVERQHIAGRVVSN